MIQDYVALDLETTGLHPVRDRILEIGAIRVKQGKIEDRYSTLVDCRMRIPERITELTGITDEMLEEARAQGRAPEVSQAVAELLEFCGDLPLLGHNILFDYSFVKQNAWNCGLEFEKEGIDTLKIAKVFLSDLPSRSLEALCAYYQIDTGGHHRAVEDAMAAASLYNHLAEAFETKEEGQAGRCGIFLPAKLVCNVKKQVPATKMQKAYLIDLVKYHRITLDVSIDSLTKSEASRMIDRILFSYGRIKR